MPTYEGSLLFQSLNRTRNGETMAIQSLCLEIRDRFEGPRSNETPLQLMDVVEKALHIHLGRTHRRCLV